MLTAFALTLALVPTPAATVIRAPCPGAAEARAVSPGACADPTTSTIYVPAGSDRFTFRHELGHLFPLTGAQRAHLERLLGFKRARPWDSGTGLAGFHSPAERFADIYAACSLRLDPMRDWQMAYDYIPTRGEFRRDCAAIARYGSGTAK